MAQYKDKYGKFFASKEKLWVLPGTFTVPKSSPLYARIMEAKYNVHVLTILSFQRDFNVAVASWLDSGIYQKMKNDIITAKDLRGHFDDAFWVPQQMLSNEPLTIGHALPAFIILGLGILSSTITFIGQILHQQYKKRTARKARIGMRHAWMP